MDLSFTLPLPARAIGLIEDNAQTGAVSEDRYAFIPLAPNPVSGELVVVDLGTSPPQLVPILQSPVTIPGRALDIVLHHQLASGQQRLYAYVSSDSNNLSTVPESLIPAGTSGSSGSSLTEALSGESESGDEPIPIPRDGEGGGDLLFIRDLYLPVFDVTPPNPPGHVVAQFRLSASGFLLDNVPALESMGLAFAPGTDLLYVVSPDTDSVFVFGTNTSPMTLVGEIPGIGDKPSDVGIVKADTNGNGVQDEQDEDRAYITNELGDSVTILRSPDHSLVQTRNLTPGARPVSVEVRRDRLRAYILAPGTETVSPTVTVIRLSDNGIGAEIGIVSGPRRISIQKP